MMTVKNHNHNDVMTFKQSLLLLGDDKITVCIGDVVESIGKQKKVNLLHQTTL